MAYPNRPSAAGLMQFFSPKARITLVLPEQLGGTQVISPRDYQSLLQQSWSMPAQFQYAVSGEQIVIGDDGQTATIKDVTTESIRSNGRVVMSSRSAQRAAIILTPKGLRIIQFEAQMQ